MAVKTSDRSKMKEYNIYAGLGGGFGGKSISTLAYLNHMKTQNMKHGKQLVKSMILTKVPMA